MEEKVKTINKYLVPLVASFHLIGLGIFLYLGEAPQLSWVTIAATSILVFVKEPNIRKAVLPFGFILLFGYLIELTGVQTGYLFGSYSYSSSMGPGLFETPLVIGFCWYAVVVGGVSISRYIPGSKLARSLLTGLLTVVLDIGLEGTAKNYNLWQWEDGVIPFYNYFCWFLFSTLFAYLHLSLSREQNKFAVWVYIIWLIFFVVLAGFPS